MSSTIDSIKQRIAELRQIMNADIGASFKEAVQTEEMIKMLELQLVELESLPLVQERIEFILKDNEGNIQKVCLTDSSPDPLNNIFTKESPFGKKLLNSKNGEQIEFRKRIYKIEKN